MNSLGFIELHRRRKILLAYDNSDFSKYVYNFCVSSILIPNHDHVSLATVIDEEQSALLMAFSSTKTQANENMKKNKRLSFSENKEAQEILKPLAEELASRGITSNYYILKGDPKTQLVKLAANTHSDLFIVGTRGLGMVKRQILGSVSDYIVRHSDCPVFVVKEKGEKAKSRSRPASMANSVFSPYSLEQLASIDTQT
ncbi:hypothetical protein G9A89_001376 [Geosiphon pyriformis]|nr:hypothetical protein G9A89_001376 [Geosiphon pyriformis]